MTKRIKSVITNRKEQTPYLEQIYFFINDPHASFSDIMQPL